MSTQAKNEASAIRITHLISVLFIGLLIITGEFLYFKSTITSSHFFGEGVDCQFNHMILSHWYDVFTGKAPLRTLRAFWPQTETLGYSDTMLVPGIIYTFLRLCGFSSTAAFNPTFILMHTLGVLFLYLTLRKLGCKRIIAFTGLLLSLWSCANSQLLLHVQFFCLGLIPVFLYFALSYISSQNSDWKKRLPYGFGATISLALTFLSSFYVGYLFSLYLGIAIILYCLLLFLRSSKQIHTFIHVLWVHRKEVLVYGILFFLFLLPMLYIYLPVYKTLGNYDTGFTIALAPMPYDFLRTFSYAPVERFFADLLPFSIDSGYEYYAVNRLAETSYGWPIFASILFLITFFHLLIKRSSFPQHLWWLCISSSLAVIVLYLLSCRYGSFCPWVTLRHILPGAGAIRALGRCLPILSIPMSIVLCLYYSNIWEEISKRSNSLPYLLILFLSLSLLISAQCRRFMEIDSATIQNTLESIPLPPSDCDTMFILYAQSDKTYDYKTNMLAWQIADHFDINTVNGYSGNFPPDWKLASCGQEDYLQYLKDWLMLHQISNTTPIYAYIPEYKQWVAYNELFL